jgi:hypothetical protein
MSIQTRKPLPDDEIVVHVPKGLSGKVSVVESDAAALPNEITVQVSRKRVPGTKPVLGVIVK